MGSGVARRPGGRSRLVRWLTSRTVARVAVVGLALGIATLASLAVLASALTRNATAHMREVDEVIGVWSDVVIRINAEDAALREFLATGGTDYRRQALVASVDSARPGLNWLGSHAGAVDQVDLDLIRGVYANYSRIIVEILAMTDKGGRVQGYAELAELAFAPLREAVLDNVSRKRQELQAYLRDIEHRDAQLRIGTTVVVAVAGLLFAACAVILIGYQRRAERQAAESQHEATHDPLTGLGNRSMLREQLRLAIDGSDATGDPVSLLLIDLDRFKEINDTLGHHHGDELLCRVAERLCGAVRSTDSVARLGGDEFALVLPSTFADGDALDVATRILAALRQPLELGGVTVDIGASIGIAAYPADSADALELLQHADVAMYVAKRGGYGLAVYDPDDDENSPGRLSMQSDLRQGVERGELVVHYQPKVDLPSGRAVGVEALVRWQHPERGLLGPGEFIPVAEESDLIELITVEVLNQALRQAGEWLRAGHRMSMAVNVPARSLLDREFPATVADCLARHRVPAELLVLEVTESALITDPDRANDVMRRLREGGAQLSIDDFGTGYASIAYLREVPLHELKIDRSFVTTMLTDPHNETIVRVLVDLARNLNLRVIAEGVEDEATVRALADLRCDAAQGYHFSRPLPAADLTSWLLARPGVPAQPAGGLLVNQVG
jgi:diguanylate cyclase (GGDEF)-like protein